MEISRLTRDGTTEPDSRDQILRRERGQGNIHFSCLADHVQDWQPYLADLYSCYMCDHIYMAANSARGQLNREKNIGDKGERETASGGNGAHDKKVLPYNTANQR